MIVAGIGSRKGVTAGQVLAAIDAALAAHGLRRDELGLLATAVRKRDEAGLRESAEALGLELRVVEDAALIAASDRTLTQSEASMTNGGTPSVSEASALAAAGHDARLLGPRVTCGGVTCAIAISDAIARAGDSAGRAARSRPMTVHFIGAGPGAADLITLRGRDLIARCPVCLYAGSIVPAQLLRYCPDGARIVDTAPLSLDEIEQEFLAAHGEGKDVARLHSGDLSIWSAVAEQVRRLERNGIEYTMTPGVPSFAAAAAALKRELTIPALAQSLVLTRISGRASEMPEGETLAGFGRTGATLAIHLAIHALPKVVEELTPLYGADCPVAIVARASWPDERIVRGTLATIEALVAAEPIERTALIFVGRSLAAEDFRESSLYDGAYQRRFRGRDG